MRDDVVEAVFSLFTSADRASAMTGDLAEEREQRGPLWFWLHVARVSLALWRNAATDAPLRALALMLAGVASLSASAFVGIAAVFLFPRSVDSPAGWIALPLLWWSGASWTGAALVAIAPRPGMTACATLAVAGEAVLMATAGPAVWRDPSNTDFVLVCTTALLSAMPLLAGAVVARRRIVPCRGPGSENVEENACPRSTR